MNAPAKPTKTLPKITAEQLSNEENRSFSPTADPGKRLKCPDCGTQTFEWTNSLERAVPKVGHVVVLKHLTGFRCLSCGAEALDLASAVAVEREEASSPVADYAVSLTKQGDRRAIFLNRDLARIARPEDVREVILTPLDRDNWLVRFVRRGSKERADIPEGSFANSTLSKADVRRLSKKANENLLKRLAR